VTDRKPPSIQLTSLNTGHDAHFASEETETIARGLDLADIRLYDGILMRRFCAAIVDFVLASVLSTVLWLATCMASIMTLGLLAVPAILLAPVVIHVAMSSYLMAGAHGATIGMRSFGLRVVNLEGRKIDHVQAFLMVAMYFATITVFFPVLAVGFFTQRARLLHDIVVGTVVVRADPA
jgi:uncharacterized RDD family membrane protein YckC